MKNYILMGILVAALVLTGCTSNSEVKYVSPTPIAIVNANNAGVPTVVPTATQEVQAAPTVDSSLQIIEVNSSHITKKNGNYPQFEPPRGVVLSGNKAGQNISVPFPSGTYELSLRYLMCNDANPVSWKIGAQSGVINTKTNCNLDTTGLGNITIQTGESMEFSSQGEQTGSDCCWVFINQIGLKKS